MGWFPGDIPISGEQTIVASFPHSLEFSAHPFLFPGTLVLSPGILVLFPGILVLSPGTLLLSLVPSSAHGSERHRAPSLDGRQGAWHGPSLGEIP